MTPYRLIGVITVDKAIFDIGNVVYILCVLVMPHNHQTAGPSGFVDITD